MEKEKVVVIGASELQNPLILKAQEMGYEVHTFAWQDGSIGERTSDYFYPISIIEKDIILEKCREIKPVAIVSIASDLANITVQYISKELGLPHNNNVLISTNKYEMRRALSDNHISVPEYHKVSIGEDLSEVYKMKLPIIVKPTDRSGSRGITKLDTFDGLIAAIESSASYSFEKKAIVEEFIDGNEYSCECISFKGKHNFLAITKKYTTGAPHFIETGHCEPSDLSDDIIEKVKDIVFKSLDALEISCGASHSEFKIDAEGNIKIIEIGSRMGGDCIGSDLVRLSTGYDFIKMVIQTAMGIKPDFAKVCEPMFAAIRFIFSKEDYETFEKLKSEHSELINYISKIRISEDAVVDSSSRYGYYIMTGTTDQIELIRKMLV